MVSCQTSNHGQNGVGGPRSSKAGESTRLRLENLLPQNDGMSEGERPDIPSFIRRMMPDADEPALQEAAEVFDAYMELVLEIARRLDGAQDVDSTERRRRGRVDGNSPGL
jgi:hypothetical protein